LTVFEGFLSPMHMLIVAVIAVLLFGDRLPEVMRSMGRGLSEFKKGMRGLENSMNQAADSSSRANVSYTRTDDRDDVPTPRFDPPTSEPRAEAAPHEGEHHDAPAHQEPAQPA
jgi:sec-independent protein translocase protein TatA